MIRYTRQRMRKGQFVRAGIVTVTVVVVAAGMAMVALGQALPRHQTIPSTRGAAHHARRTVCHTHGHRGYYRYKPGHRRYCYIPPAKPTPHNATTLPAEAPGGTTPIVAGPAAGAKLPTDGPVCPVGHTSAESCPCPSNTTTGGATTIPGGYGSVAIQSYPGWGGPNSNICPGIELAVDDSQGGVAATASNVAAGSTTVFPLPPGSYKATGVIAREPNADSSQAFTVTAGQETKISLEPGVSH
jgi:hypothetical protein